MKPDSKHKAASFGRLSVIFTGIMLLFLALIASQTAEKLKLEHERKSLKSLESSLDQVIAQTSDEAYIQNRFQQLISTARQAGIESPELENEIARCINNYKTPLKAFFYRNNKLIKAFNETPEDLRLFYGLMQKLYTTGHDFAEAQRQVHSSMLATFGPGHRLELMKISKATQKRYKGLQKDRFYYWNDYPDGLGVFFIATSIPTFIERFTIINPERDKFGAGNPEIQKWIAPTGLTEDQTAAARIKARISGQNYTSANGFIWYFADDETGAFWCRVISHDDHENTRPCWAENLQSFAILMFCLTLLIYLTACANIAPGSKISDSLDSISIKYRILGLFSMASVFPVIFTILIGATSIADRKEVIENGIVSESIAAIEPLEKMYNIRIEQIKAMSADIRKALITEPASEKMFRHYLDKHSIPRLLSRIEVRDDKCNVLFTTDDRQVHGVSEAMDVFSRIAIKLLAPARMGAAANKITPAEVVSESILSTDEIGMATIIRQRGRLWLFRMGTFPTTWYWDVYPEIATGPAFMNVTTQMLEIYLQQVQDELKTKRLPPDSMQLASELNYHFSNFRVFPKKPGLPATQLLNTAITSFRTNRVIFREILIDQQPFWVTAKPEKNINTHVFFHLISQNERLKTLAPFKWQLAIGSLVALVMSLLGAALITKLTILPLDDLNNGIKAIRNRHKEFRISVRRRDELGSLATAFNRVISELEELEYGRIVQESLLPAGPIVPEGYDIAFFNTSATDLAGDYHDVIELNDGRLAFVLGDVTGHGISAALAMAMAKATVNYTEASGELFPSGLIDMLNALFNRELKPRNKFMTLAIMVLDPATGKLEIENAGQSYPRLYHAATDSSDEIELPSMPLGAMKKRKSKVETRIMQAGDSVILYTDGIIECSDQTGDMYGYNRFRDSFESLMRQKTGANEALKIMMQRLNSFRVPGPYPDDVTMLIIKKL